MDNSHSQSEFKERLEAMLGRGRGRGNPLHFPNPAFANTRPLLPQPPPPPNMTTNVATSHNSQFLHQQLSMSMSTPIASSSNSGSGSNDSFSSTSQGQHVEIRNPPEQLSLMTSSLSAPTLSNSNFENRNSHRNENSCKSPRRMTPGRARIWSPVICTVCMEDLFAYSDPTDVNPYSNRFDLELGESHGAKRLDEIRPTVSTRCGHLFHTECINKWFIEKKESEIKECPFCKREIMANDTTRVFPIFGDD